MKSLNVVVRVRTLSNSTRKCAMAVWFFFRAEFARVKYPI